MPVHLAQMNSVKQEDPTTSEALKSGDFFVAKSQVPFIALFTDQALKRHGGIVGLSQMIQISIVSSPLVLNLLAW